MMPVIFLFMSIFSDFDRADSVTNKEIGNHEYYRNTSGVLSKRASYSLRHYGPVVKKYSERFGIDWRLMFALMNQESRFYNEAESHRGAFGLMQITPTTQIEIMEELGLNDAKSPYNNIKGGIYHFSKMWQAFPGLKDEDRMRLALAAYNAGLTRIEDARKITKYLGHDEDSWDDVKHSLIFLNRRHSTLHSHVWESGRPDGGYLTGWKETSAYVDKVMRYYGEYCKYLM